MMELDVLIEKLNRKILSTDSGFEKLDIKDLTPAEHSLLEKYKPGISLIIYGSLAPGRSNHSEVEHIKGEWRKGIVKGKLLKLGWGAAEGYLAFQHTQTDEQKNIEAFVLFSEEFINNWPRLDEFEGDDYRRILARYELDNGATGIGNIYAINPVLQ